MIARDQEVRHPTLRGQPVDDGHEADVPLRNFLSMGHSIAGLQNESHRRVRGLEFGDLREDSIHHLRVLGLEGNAIMAPASVTIEDE